MGHRVDTSLGKWGGLLEEGRVDVADALHHVTSFGPSLGFHKAMEDSSVQVGPAQASASGL